MNKLLLLFVPFFIFVTGCRTIVYENTQENRKVTYSVFGLNTSLGKLEVQTPQGGKVVIENHTSDASAALDILSKTVDKIPAK